MKLNSVLASGLLMVIGAMAAPSPDLERRFSAPGCDGEAAPPEGTTCFCDGAVVTRPADTNNVPKVCGKGAFAGQPVDAGLYATHKGDSEGGQSMWFTVRNNCADKMTVDEQKCKDMFYGVINDCGASWASTRGGFADDGCVRWEFDPSGAADHNGN